MSNLSVEAVKRIRQIDALLHDLEKEAAHEPDGRVRVSNTGGRCRYYCVGKGENTGRYIKKSEVGMAAALAQKDYREKMMLSLRQERELLLKLNDLYCRNNDCTGSEKTAAGGNAHFCHGPEELIWRNLHESRRELVRPAVQDDQMFVENWLSDNHYVHKDFREDTPEYYTESGIRVRSKTELIIAEQLERAGIPFFYEKPLLLNGQTVYHPDFTALNVRLRKVFYWEHMGMMDDADYRRYALDKINKYELAGLYPGVDLILTHETSGSPISTRIIRRVIERYLL